MKCADTRNQIYMVIVHVSNIALYLAYACAGIIHNDKSWQCVSLYYLCIYIIIMHTDQCTMCKYGSLIAGQHMHVIKTID